jgi:hypothetical protein
MPTPTQPGLNNNFNINRTSFTDVNQFDIRIDENISSKDSIFGRYSWSQSPSLIPGPFTAMPTAADLAPAIRRSTRKAPQ